MMDTIQTDETLQHHAAGHRDATDCTLLPGNAVHLLDGGAPALAAIFDAIEAATDHLHLEYYTFQDVHVGGRSLSDLLIARLRAGVRVAIIYDSVGSSGTPDALFHRLAAAGALVLEFHPVNPLRRHFAWHLNDRDHRKLLIADGRTAFIGGVNLSPVYQNPPEAGAPADADQAFWYDTAVRLEGPAVAEVQRLFLHTWRQQDGDALPPGDFFPDLHPAGDALVCIDGSAPAEKRQLYYDSLHRAVSAARHRILLATGYFVPTHDEWKLLADAADRGVQVDLLLAGYSDVPGCTHAARALYGRLIKRGVRIHEVNDGMLHAKVATIDGTWVAIGSSNLDRRSFRYNNESDAVVLGQATAAAVEAMLRRWMARADTVTLDEWRHRSLHEHAGELLARVWERYM